MKFLITKQTIKNLLKSAWVTAALIFLGVYLYRHWNTYLAVLLRIPLRYIVLSALFLITAKGFLALNLKLGAHYAGVSISYMRSFLIYTITQIAKYIPGSIWHMAGRIGYYKGAGLSNKQIRESMIVEHIFMLGGACVFGCAISIAFNYTLLAELFQKLRLLVIVPFALIVPALAGCLILRKYTAPIFLLILRNPLLNLKMIILELCIWSALGLYFASLVYPFVPRPEYLIYFCGVFALSYIAGFIIPIAPAGIGIRETVMVIGLSPLVTVEVAVTVSTLSRAVFVLTEVVLAALFLTYNKAAGTAAQPAEVLPDSEGEKQ